MAESIDYRAAGVDLDTYEETMAQRFRFAETDLPTRAPARVIEWKDGFAGLFRLDAKIGLLYAGPTATRCWWRSTDGVGTKLKLAFATGRHSTVGIDLVAMSVNDCLCAGAEPLLFLDYVAMSKDDPKLTQDVVTGISDGCIEAECACSAARPRFCPTSTRGVRPGRVLPGSRRTQARAQRQGHSAGRQGDRAWPVRASTPMATAWPGRSPSMRPASSPTLFVPELGARWPTSSSSRPESTCGR